MKFFFYRNCCDTRLLSQQVAIKERSIDKPNGKKRPLGVPTLADRINQQLIRSAIEPIVEYHFLAVVMDSARKEVVMMRWQTYSIS